jgi:hypothetical protein
MCKYSQKVNEFITQNNFKKVASIHTNKQQKAIKTANNICNQTISQTDEWKYRHMNPEAPHIHGTIKLHKGGKPIRPRVNWKNSSGYRIATYLARQLKDTIHLPNAFNIQNSEKLIHNLKETNIQTNTKICSFDIKNM